MGRVLVTGATGQDGSYLVERLVDEGHEVHAVVRAEVTPVETAVPPSVIVHVADLAQTDSLLGLLRELAPDAVVNLGGLTSVALSWREPVLAAEVSGVAAAALLEGAWQVQESLGREVRFLQASSSELFGNAERSPQDEDTPIRPTSPYGAAKAFAHHLVGAYRARGMHASSAILYNHESPRRPETFVTRKITASVARIARGIDHALVLGDREVRRDWGWAPDYVDAMIRMLSMPEPDTYVIATGVSHSLDDFVDSAFRHVGIDDWERLVSTDPALLRPAETAEMCGDATRARERLDWSPSVDFEEMIGLMVDHDLRLIDTRG